MISFDGFSQQNDYENLTISDGLPSNSINAIFQDKIGYLWVGTDKGYSKFDGIKFTNFNKAKANCFFQKGDNFYIGLSKGLLIINNNKTIFFESKEILKIKSIHNKIILATVQGISELREDYIQPLHINTKIDFSIINDILQLNNTIYVASIKGLWNIEKVDKPTRIIKISNDNTISFLNQKGTIIASTLKKGLKIIKENKIIETINTIENNTSIKKVNDEIWVTTEGNGIEVLNEKNYTFKRNINKYNSTISNEINTVFKDNQNNLWVASNNGLYKFNSNNNSSKPVNPTIYIENVSVNYNKVDFNNNNLIELKPDQNNISIAFKTIALNNSSNIQYRYQIKEEFTPWSSQNKVEFANLSSGKYTFKVQSKKGKLVSNIKSIHFTIDAPIYKKAWFILLLVSLLFLVFALLLELRLKRIKKRNKKEVSQLKLENYLLNLEQKALQLQMNPHFIFNVLNGIKSLGNSGKTLDLNKAISQFSILLRSVLNNSRLEEISLNDEIETLKSYLDLEKSMNSKIFYYTIDTSLNNIDSEEILVPPMIMQPFIENCIKHGIQLNTTNGVIQIKFEVKSNFLHCIITDNGIGFHQSKKNSNKEHQSLALSVTKERIQNLSKYHSFSIEEIKENDLILGTKVSFKLPLKTDY